MRALKIISWVFAPIGLVLLVVGLLMTQNTRSFLAEAISADGQVVDMVRRRNQDSDGRTTYTYAPVVTFADRGGAVTTFTSSTGSNPPAYEVGDSVEVLYRPSEPEHARLRGFFNMWLGPLLFTFMGFVFFLIGGGMIFARMLTARKINRLKRDGRKIKARVTEIELNTNLTVNGKNPFIIIATWTNPSTGHHHTFKSQNLWSDPAGQIRDDEVKVIIDRENPDIHWIDTTFLD